MSQNFLSLGALCIRGLLRLFRCEGREEDRFTVLTFGRVFLDDCCRKIMLFPLVVLMIT